MDYRSDYTVSGSKWKIVLIGLLFVSCSTDGNIASNEPTLNKKSTQSNISVRLIAQTDAFTSSDSMRFILTLTNTSNSPQRILFDYGNRNQAYPSNTIFLLNHASGTSVPFTSWESYSSRAFTIEQLDKLSWELNAGDSISRSYNLRSVMKLDTENGKLANGTYTLQAIHDNVPSNRISFSILQK